MWGLWKFLVRLLTMEFLLTRYANGGPMILWRTLWTTTLAYATALALSNAVNPDLSWRFSPVALGKQLAETMPWYAAIFAGIYTTYYARFSAQWSYLANLYNQIKAVECAKPFNPEALAQWKAGFIEDAENLHLLRKEPFATVAKNWLREQRVRQVYAAFAPEGSSALTRVCKVLDVTRG
jgi:hypothetical protein